MATTRPQPLTRRFHLAPVQFVWAGLSFPRWLPPRLDGARAPWRDRLGRRLHPTVGPYMTAPRPNGSGPWSFYLGADAPFELRVQFAADYTDRARRWYADADGIDTCEGIVARLPRGRGFLAGWTLGEGMASCLEPTTYADPLEAAHAADESARIYALEERDRELRTCGSCGHEHAWTDWLLCDGCGEPNPERDLPENWCDAHVPSHWLPALVNGDSSGLDDDDAAAVDHFADTIGGPVIHYTDAGFRAYHDGGPLAADCARIWFERED